MKKKIALVLFLLVFVIYPLSFWYELHKIESFCESITTDTKVVNLTQIATDFGVESKYGGKTLSNGIKNDDGTFSAFVASMFSMGEARCSIKHDGKIVLKAEYKQ